VRIYVSIPNPSRNLVSGLFAQARIAAITHDALAIPASALDERGASPVVYRVRQAKVERVPVDPGLRDDAAEKIEIRSGLAAGDTVLLGSAQGLSPGSEVRVRREPVSSQR
jgi:hypothetical protein